MVIRCAETFLSQLPSSVRVVIMLGNGDAYINGCRRVISSMYGQGFQAVNAVAYQTESFIWVHAAHASGMNGHFDTWMAGIPTKKSGRKLVLALEALSHLHEDDREAA